MTDTIGEPLAYRPLDALKVFPIGETKLYELLGTGAIKSFRVGTARMIPRQALIDYMDRLLAEQTSVATDDAGTAPMSTAATGGT